MSDSRLDDPPSPFVAHWCTALAPQLPAPRRALDIAMGRGRHLELVARIGYQAFGVDRNLEAVREARDRARRNGHRPQTWVADLTSYSLPRGRFELIVVSRYLQRDLFAALRAAVVPGGVIVYETFTEAQRALGSGPTSADHLLAAGELRQRFAGFIVEFFEEISTPQALARIVARRPADSSS